MPNSYEGEPQPISGEGLREIELNEQEKIIVDELARDYKGLIRDVGLWGTGENTMLTYWLDDFGYPISQEQLLEESKKPNFDLVDKVPRLAVRVKAWERALFEIGSDKSEIGGFIQSLRILNTDDNSVRCGNDRDGYFVLGFEVNQNGRRPDQTIIRFKGRLAKV